MSVDGTDFGDSMVGDAGANSFRGDKGDDVLTGGGGSDYLSGGAGNDTIDARDGGSDAANCGSGDDHARTDALGVDRVSSCEHVDSPADACAPMDRFLAAHPSPNHLGTPSRPKNGGLYIGKTIFGLPVRLNISADGRSFVPASRLSYKWCAKHRVTRVDIKISHDRIAADGSFDINHHGRSTSHVRHLRGRFYDHGRKVSGVITETAVGGHGGPVTFEAALTKRS
jgi:hypothetical protein